jgi:hypothetical protein
MPAAVPLIAVVAGGVASAAVGGGIIGALVGAGAAIGASLIGNAIFPQKKPRPPAFSSALDAQQRTQSFRQPITAHQIVLGRAKVSGPIVFLHSSPDDEGRADGYFYMVVVLAGHRVRSIGEVFLGDKSETDPVFTNLVRVDRHLGDANQTADANLIAETGGKWTSDHRGRGRAYVSLRLKLRPEAFPSGPPNVAAIVEGADTILDPRTNTLGWTDNPGLCLAWYLTASFGWKASWDDIDIPSLIAAANICDEIVGRRDGTSERRYTVNGTLSLSEGKIEITRKIVDSMAGVLVVSGGKFFIHAGAPALPAATITSDDLRGTVAIQGSRPRRDLFNGVRAVYVDPDKNWQPTDAPPLLATNYVTEDGGEVIYRDLDFPLVTSASTVQRLMKIELERNRRQRSVTAELNLSALRVRPWDLVTVSFDRMASFPARVVGWRLAPEGGVDLRLVEEDAAVWDWDPAIDERATGDSPSVVLPQPGVIGTPATITVQTPQTVSFSTLSFAWAAVNSAYLAGYEVEFRPLSVTIWQGFAGGLSALSATIPVAEPTAVRVRAQARSGAASGWREALVPAAPSGLTATGVNGGIQVSGTVPNSADYLQVFEATTNDVTTATKLSDEPTALPWTRTGLTSGQTRWLWLRSVSPEGNVSALAGPVTATAL